MERTTREFAANFIDREFARPQSNKVLHAHPSPMYWQPDSGQSADRWKRRSELSHTLTLKDNLYLGLPFCLKTEPAHCGFCLFPTQDYQGKNQLRDYLGYLELEAELMADYLKNGSLSSIYVGGGTPNLMREDEYERVLNIARRLYGDIPDDIEITLEGIPQLFTPDKIDAIRSAGFNRVSMGVQQMSDHLIHYSGRKQTHQQVVDAIEHFKAAGLGCNVDLIFGWPDQTMDDMLNDLKELVSLGVTHITHYQLNIAGRSAFSKRLRGHLPDLDLVIEMYRESCRYLQSQGYRQATVYDWEWHPENEDAHPSASGSYQYEAHLRDFIEAESGQILESQAVIGLGYAAISVLPNGLNEPGLNWSQMNARSLQQYYGAIEAGQLPTERSFVHEPDDLKLVWLFQSMQALEIPRARYYQVFGSDVFVEFEPIWEELHSRGWIEVMADRIRFVDLGAFHIPMLQALLSYNRLEEIRLSRADDTEPRLIAKA